MTTEDEIQIRWSGQYFEIELLTNDTVVKFKSAATADEALAIAKEWIGKVAF